MNDLSHLQETLIHAILNERFIPSTRNIIHAILNERFIPSTRNTHTCYIK